MSSYYYSHDGQQFGPVSAADLRELAASGQLGPQDPVAQEGVPKWFPAGSIRGLFAASVPPAAPIAAATSPAAAPASATPAEAEHAGPRDDQGPTDGWLDGISEGETHADEGFPAQVVRNFTRSCWPTPVGVVIGVLLAPLLSMLKPVLGYRAVWGVVLGIAVIAAFCAVVYLGQQTAAHFVPAKERGDRWKKSWFARIAQCGTLSLIPLLAMAVIENFTPPTGAVKAVWAYFQNSAPTTNPVKK
jgi:hypothetical protein